MKAGQLINVKESYSDLLPVDQRKQSRLLEEKKSNSFLNKKFSNSSQRSINNVSFPDENRKFMILQRDGSTKSKVSDTNKININQQIQVQSKFSKNNHSLSPRDQNNPSGNGKFNTIMNSQKKYDLPRKFQLLKNDLEKLQKDADYSYNEFNLFKLKREQSSKKVKYELKTVKLEDILKRKPSLLQKHSFLQNKDYEQIKLSDNNYNLKANDSRNRIRSSITTKNQKKFIMSDRMKNQLTSEVQMSLNDPLYLDQNFLDIEQEQLDSQQIRSPFVKNHISKSSYQAKRYNSVELPQQFYQDKVHTLGSNEQYLLQSQKDNSDSLDTQQASLRNEKINMMQHYLHKIQKLQKN